MTAKIPNALATQRRWIAARAQTEHPVDMRVGVAASFTVEPIEAYLGVHLLEAGIQASIRFADFNQIHQVCLDPERAVGSVDALIFVWRVEDVFEAGLGRYLNGDDVAGDDLVEDARNLGLAIAKLAESSTFPVVTTIPPLLRPTRVDPYDSAVTAPLAELHSRIVRAYLEALSTSQARLADLASWEASFGSSGARDATTWFLYKQPYTSDFYQVLGIQIGDILIREVRSAPKCVILDCDNTLWGGIVGEDGIGGIEIGSAPPGNSYREFQKVLKALKQRGVLLAVASKNNPDDVLEVFRSHDEMVLGVDDIAVWRVNWQPKSTSILEIASELNIGIDSIVFVDDSEYEVAEVKAAVPGVTCLVVPEDPALLPDLVHKSGLFRNLRVSDEDLKRTEMIVAEQVRRVAASASTDTEFLASLGLELGYFAAAEEHVGRVAQLTNKTNQFNLTTIRRSEAEIRALIESAEYEVRAIRVRDRFGDYGLVGVAVLDRSQDEWAIDTLLMSCRVLGRGVDTAFIHTLVSEAMESGASAVAARFIPTLKNGQVADLYERHGFTPVAEGRYRINNKDELVDAPTHISIV